MKSFTKTLIAISSFLIIGHFAKAQQTTGTSHPKISHTYEKIEKEWNYAQVYKSGNMLYISGIPASGSAEQAMKSVYTALNKILAKYKIDITHVVKENLYTTNIEDVIKFKDVRKSFYGDHTPASTWAEVKRFLVPTATLEIDFVVELEKKN